ncbi:DUF6194 family protein [Nocardia thailandica]
MTVDDLLEYLTGLPGVLHLAPGPGSAAPEIAWGDHFFYFAPDGVVPSGQPFATVVTKDYPGEPSSGLDRPGAFRVNIAAGRDAFAAWSADATDDPAARDVVLPHPVYAAAAWLAVVDPGPRTEQAVRELLREAHSRARARYERRHGD